jgi:hypothetical protein
MKTPNKAQRRKLLREITEFADLAIFGTLSETYRTCGQPTCRCHGSGPKHGPHLQVSFRGEHGKTTGYYVPTAAQDDIRRGADAWREIQDRLKILADENRQAIIERARSARAR